MEIIINFEVIHKLNHLSHGIQVEFLKNIMDMSLQGGHLHAAHGTDFRAFIALTKKIQNIDFGLCQLSDQHEIPGGFSPQSPVGSGNGPHKHPLRR